MKEAGYDTCLNKFAIAERKAVVMMQKKHYDNNSHNYMKHVIMSVMCEGNTYMFCGTLESVLSLNVLLVLRSRSRVKQKYLKAALEASKCTL